MATQKDAPQDAPVVKAEAGDRVTMLSLRADGTPDQTNPVVIGDKEWAVDAAKRQFAEKAVSDLDDARRRAESGTAEMVGQDPVIAARQAAHEEAKATAEKAAEKVITELHEG